MSYRAAFSSTVPSFPATERTFYAHVPYRLPSERYRKSPHALWGTLPSLYTDPVPVAEKHPLLALLTSGRWDAETLSTKNDLSETVYVVDTDLRKQQEADRITSSIFPHKLPGLYMISGVGMLRATEVKQSRPEMPNPMEYRHLLATSSFRAPMSPVILLLLLDPYPTKQLRGAIHALFLSLLTDARFKCRFAAALGIAYRPLSTLFCAGVGTEADTPLGFTVQIFTAGSLVRALGSAPAVEKLLLADTDDGRSAHRESSIGVFTIPIALTVVRCIHTNLLGATKEVQMILNNTASGNDNDSHENIHNANDGLLSALTYVAGEHPLLTLLPAAPDDGFLDSRSTRHKRLPHLLRDLEYVIETPGTAMRLLLPNQFPAYQGVQLSSRGGEILTFCTVWSRLLRLAQGMDPQKRKISGGHVEYEQNRWLEAFGLSLNFAGTRDALSESPTNSSSAALAPVSEDGTHLVSIREAMGNIIGSLLRELKLWLYREGMLETGLPVPPGGAHGASDLSQVEALQRSTLHVAASQLGSSSSSEGQTSSPSNVSTVALSCATSVRMTEAQLDLIESALRLEGAQRQYMAGGFHRDGAPSATTAGNLTSGALMGDWLRVPHSPLVGDSLSFHLPLHRALAKTVRSLCAVVVPESSRNDDSRGWWKLPVLDKAMSASESISSNGQHPLVPLIRPILRSSNCRVAWADGPECTPQDAQRRRARSRTVSANIAVAKIIHSLADHPIRCLAAAQQIERHLWARNGSSVAGMALNYSNAPLCRSFRDLDLTLVQLSAAGMSVGLGARRVFSLLISRFSLDGYLCDPERRAAASGGGNGSYAAGLGTWVNPPRLQEKEHATILSESLFATLCILVTELPPPPPISSSDETWLRQSIRREMIHALAAEPRSHSAAMTAASCAVGRRDESDGSAGTSGGGGLFRDVFAQVLKEVGKQKNQGSRAASGPACFELDAACCDEYDPTFFHLRRQEHQHAMDVVASLRKQKLNREKDHTSGVDPFCFPLVCQPPRAHPRFIACRLILHLPPMDAAIRRALLFALTGGSWLPPPEPPKKQEKVEDDSSPANADNSGISMSLSTESAGGDVPVMTFSRRCGVNPSNLFPKRGSSFSEGDPNLPFSSDVVAASSVSFLEVLQLLTLQVHSLEECASLHRLQPDLDEEAKSLSAGLSINSYLGRLVHVPESLVDVWALLPYPDGPLKSKGSGEKRGSILGLLIALYEHRADHGAGPSGSGQDDPGDGHGGARALAASGLQWLLRFVHALVDGAPSVGAAAKSATTGIPIKPSAASNHSTEASGMTIWTIDGTVRFTISNMLSNLPDLWPKPVEESVEKESSANKEKKERGKAAQQRMLDIIRKKQSAFITSMGATETKGETKESGPDEEEADLCIICRCDDADGENNGPLGFLGHVQRSRVAQMRACCEAVGKAGERDDSNSLFQQYRVVGHMGCQVRETKVMDSRPVDCLPRGSIVRVRKNTVSDKYDIMSRRVYVEHISEDTGKLTVGWASVQSSQGYVILSPLVPLCYENTRWGSTRPIIRQCGHAAHLKCVETHTLSLHQRAAGEQPYDGRFAANIDDGEFLCPLCKQLSNILIPRDGCSRIKEAEYPASVSKSKLQFPRSLEESLQNLLTRGTYMGKKEADAFSEIGQKALADFGSHLMQAMAVPWERSTGSRKRKQRKWHPAIQRWDYEEEDDDIASEAPTTVRSVLRLLRQQQIAWAAVGHSAAAAEAAVRGIEEVLPFGSFSKTDEPWPGYENSKDNHPMVLELTRTMTGTAGLLEVLIFEMNVQLSGNSIGFEGNEPSVVSKCLADILCGYSWAVDLKDAKNGNLSVMEINRLALWSEITALICAMPCHVARDGMLSQRHEARAAAAEMWVSRGLGTQSVSNGEPPAPLAVSKLFKNVSPRPPDVNRHWGSLAPTANEETPLRTPFRPAVATAFLYAPLLSWDLNTLAGAVFSSILVNTTDELPSSEDMLNCARLLITGRMVQALITPHGFDSIDGMEIDEGDEEGRWNPDEVQAEGEYLARLYSHCKARVESESIDRFNGVKKKFPVASSVNLFASVSRAILPFARSVILMMRACNSAVKTRHRRKGSTLDVSDTHSATALESILDGSETMTTNEGFFILKEMKGPMPSAVMDESGIWWNLVNRWLTSVITLERHHGSRGKSVLTDLFPPVGSRLRVDEDQTMTSANSHSGFPRKDASGEKLKQGSPLADSDASIPTDGHASSEADAAGFGEELGQNEIPMGRRFFNDSLGEESDEELMEDMEMDIDEAEEMLDFAETAAEIAGAASAAASNDGEESADEFSSSGSDEGESNDSLSLFAGVAQSPIISYQPSLLAQQPIGPGKEGSMFEAATASAVMADLSHLGLVHRKDTPTFSLIRLPKSFVELYGIVNKVKGRDESTALDDTDDVGNTETAICLLTGAVMRSGSSRRSFHRAQRPPGACTHHARKNGSGIGIFFLVQKCTVLLMHNNKSAYSASLYVDEHGEEDPGLRRGRPLFLNNTRYRALEQLWRQQGVPREVAQIRSTSDRVIRDNWY
jgi:Proteolysis_6 C-terminal